jgi:hypothetical protein
LDGLGSAHDGFHPLARIGFDGQRQSASGKNTIAMT